MNEKLNLVYIIDSLVIKLHNKNKQINLPFNRYIHLLSIKNLEILFIIFFFKTTKNNQSQWRKTEKKLSTFIKITK